MIGRKKRICLSSSVFSNKNKSSFSSRWDQKMAFPFLLNNAILFLSKIMGIVNFFLDLIFLFFL